MKKKKGFTLIELLVVIAIIAMLLAILMPALGKVKKLAMRLVCGTNVKGLGTAMNVYAFDYDDEYPVQGASSGRLWGDKTDGWQNVNPWGNSAGKVTTEASLYMLVREADVSPKSFICQAASGHIAFSISEDPDIKANASDYELTELYDFGMYPAGGWDGNGGDVHVSYSYQQVNKVNNEIVANKPSASGNSANVILADKNPWSEPSLKQTTGRLAAADEPDYVEWVARIKYVDAGNAISESSPHIRAGNSVNHDREGQNVLFNDGHAEFAKRPDVSYNNDNIYTAKTGNTEEDRRVGSEMTGFDTKAVASSSTDTLLVSSSGHP